MAETVIYMRGPFPFDTNRSGPGEILEDIKVVLDIEPEQLRSIAQSIEAFVGFLDASSLQAILTSYVSDDARRQRLSDVITRLAGFLRRTEQSIDELLTKLQQWQTSQSTEEALSNEQFETLRVRLPLVIKQYESLERQAKAQRLSEVTGLRLEDIQVICDLRPVFNREHNNIEGIMPYTTLRVVCKGVDGLPVHLEAVLSHKEVAKLAESASDAVKKLHTLSDFLAKHSITIPSVDLTRIDSPTTRG